MTSCPTKLSYSFTWFIVNPGHSISIVVAARLDREAGPCTSYHLSPAIATRDLRSVLYHTRAIQCERGTVHNLQPFFGVTYRQPAYGLCTLY